MFKSVTKNSAKETAEVAAKSVAEAGEHAGKLKGLWSAAKEVFDTDKAAKKLADEIGYVKSIMTKKNEEVRKMVDEANELLRDGLKKIESSDTAKENEINRIIRRLRPMKVKDLEVMSEESVRILENRLKVLEKELLENKEIKKHLFSLHELSSKGKEMDALKVAESIPQEVITKNSEIFSWKAKLDQAKIASERIINAKSKKIGSDAAFINEYLKLKRNPQKAVELDFWAANPENHTKLHKLQSTDRIYDIIERGRLSIANKIFGITYLDTAKRVGLVGAAAAVSAGAVKVYSWFNNNSPSEFRSQADRQISQLNSLGATGEGASIVGDVQRSLGKISSLSSEVGSSLDKDDAEQSIEKFITGSHDSLENIYNKLGTWDTVIKNSKDQKKAVDVGNGLATYLSDTLGKFGSLGGSLGVKIEMPKPSGDENLLKIQQSLGIPQTGKLDQHTFSALKHTETWMNERAGTDHFTGFMIDESRNYVVSHDKFMKAVGMIQKY